MESEILKHPVADRVHRSQQPVLFLCGWQAVLANLTRELNSTQSCRKGWVRSKSLRSFKTNRVPNSNGARRNELFNPI